MRKSRVLIAAAGVAAIIPSQVSAEAASSVQPAQQANTQKSAELANLFDSFDQADLAASPIAKMSRGIRDESYGRWDDFTDAAEEANLRRMLDDTARLKARFDKAPLSAEDRMSVRLFEARTRRRAPLAEMRGNVFVFDQMNGAHRIFPANLINFHSVSNEQQAVDYVSRIAGIGPAMDQLIAKSAARAAKGVMPPRWVYPKVISDIDSTLESNGDSALTGNAILDDFRAKLEKLSLPQSRNDQLAKAAVDAWKASAAPAYGRLRLEMERQERIAGTDDGVWRLPNGDAYYKQLLATYTTTAMSADEIHALGLRETARIQDEMRALMRKVGFKGTLPEFFALARTDPRFFHTSREAYLSEAQSKLDAMSKALPQWFGRLPKDRLTVKAVEPFREKTAGKGFYSGPAPDGSRPGIYYVNLYDLKELPRSELEALAYHEGIPGHHLQASITTSLGNLPAFRRFGGAIAYGEGWGLYAEQLGKDMGFFTDPYSDFGRLSMEILRAGRLVTDTGIHAKRWTREQAIAWYMANTPVAKGDVVNQVERFIVYPGQATAYTIGKLKFVELRERARAELGKKFDIRAFHDVVLNDGSVPLDILEENVEAWIARVKRQTDL